MRYANDELARIFADARRADAVLRIAWESPHGRRVLLGTVARVGRFSCGVELRDLAVGAMRTIPYAAVRGVRQIVSRDGVLDATVIGDWSEV